MNEIQASFRTHQSNDRNRANTMHGKGKERGEGKLELAPVSLAGKKENQTMIVGSQQVDESSYRNLNKSIKQPMK